MHVRCAQEDVTVIAEVICGCCTALVSSVRTPLTGHSFHDVGWSRRSSSSLSTGSTSCAARASAVISSTIVTDSTFSLTVLLQRRWCHNASIRSVWVNRVELLRAASVLARFGMPSNTSSGPPSKWHEHSHVVSVHCSPGPVPRVVQSK